MKLHQILMKPYDRSWKVRADKARTLALCIKEGISEEEIVAEIGKYQLKKQGTTRNASFKRTGF